MPLARDIAAGAERMVRIQMEAYPSHWPEADRRDLARRQLGLDRNPEPA
jgi:hypothetical protein